MHTVDNPIFEALYKAIGGEATQIALEAIVNVEVEADDKLDFVLALSVANKFDWNAERAAFWLASAEASLKKQKTKAARDERVAKWAEDNVTVGMIIKVGGTRDGRGLRKVKAIHQCSWGMEFECQKGHIDRNTGDWVDEPYITEHMSKKLTKVFLDYKWQNVVDLCK